jgi:hypothetical protein
VATQNPIEFEGTYPLPEAQLDRFLLRLSVGYPSAEAEWRMLERRLERTADEVELAQVATRADVLAMQRAVEQVHVAESVGRYMVELVAATRASPRVQVGASPAGTLALLKVARAKAALAGRDFVTPEDVKAVGRAHPGPPADPAARSCGCAGSAPRTWSPSCSEQVPTPPPRGRAGPRRSAPTRADDPPADLQDRRLRGGGRPWPCWSGWPWAGPSWWPVAGPRWPCWWWPAWHRPATPSGRPRSPSTGSGPWSTTRSPSS